MRISAFCDFGALWCDVFVDLFRDVSHETIGFGTLFGRGLSEMLRKPKVWCETSLKSQKTLRDIHSRVSPTPDETWPRKVVSRLRETLVLGFGTMSELQPGPIDALVPNRRTPPTQTHAHAHANPCTRAQGRQISSNSIYPNSRSTAIGRLLLVYRLLLC